MEIFCKEFCMLNKFQVGLMEETVNENLAGNGNNNNI